MWEIDEYGNARNTDTEDEIYIIVCPDGLSRVYQNEKVIGVFNHNADAVTYVERKVGELEDYAK